MIRGSDDKSGTWAEKECQAKLTDLDVLTEFVVANAELEQLEERLSQFNIFEAIGMQWQEIRHSAFLAFLLDPQQPHGLGDTLLTRILQRALMGASDALPVNIVELHLWSLDETTVEREWSHIDILLLNERWKLAVIIENKIWTGEHDDQLVRYYERVQGRYPGWRILALYLTPEGAKPTDPRYLTLCYGDVADLISNLCRQREATLGPDIRTLLLHYVQMLRRYIVTDAELDALCQQIYRKHRRAIDLILARIPDKQTLVHQEFINLIETTPGLRLRWQSKKQLTFHPESWDVPALQYTDGPDSPALLFQFRVLNPGWYIKILLEIRHGPEERRKLLFDMATRHGKPFRSQSGQLRKWNSVYSRLVVSNKQMPQIDTEQLIQAVNKHWAEFVKTDLPLIETVLRQQAWVWDTETPRISEAGASEEETDSAEEED